MSDASPTAQSYVSLLQDLGRITRESEQRLVQNDVDPLFSANANFFVKAYLVSLCSYLEAFLTEIAFGYAQIVGQRLQAACVPHNFACWRLGMKLKATDGSFSVVGCRVKRSEIADLLSPQPHVTVQGFRTLGIDLSSSQQYQSQCERVATIVNKRNRIIHHNDDASDVSFSDVADYIDAVSGYMLAVDNVVRHCLGGT